MWNIVLSEFQSTRKNDFAAFMRVGIERWSIVSLQLPFWTNLCGEYESISDCLNVFPFTPCLQPAVGCCVSLHFLYCTRSNDCRIEAYIQITCYYLIIGIQSRAWCTFHCCMELELGPHVHEWCCGEMSCQLAIVQLTYGLSCIVITVHGVSRLYRRALLTETDSEFHSYVGFSEFNQSSDGEINHPKPEKKKLSRK